MFLVLFLCLYCCLCKLLFCCLLVFLWFYFHSCFCWCFVVAVTLSHLHTTSSLCPLQMAQQRRMEKTTTTKTSDSSLMSEEEKKKKYKHKKVLDNPLSTFWKCMIYVCIVYGCVHTAMCPFVCVHINWHVTHTSCEQCSIHPFTSTSSLLPLSILPLPSPPAHPSPPLLHTLPLISPPAHPAVHS